MKVFIFIIFSLIVVSVFFIGLDKGWWINPPKPIPPTHKLVGVSQKEAVVLNWLREQGCKVEVPETLRTLYQLYESQNKRYDKKYEISWRVEFIDEVLAINPGDPSHPRPGSSAKLSRFYSWNSAGDTYEVLVKIKEDFQKDKSAGVLDGKN